MLVHDADISEKAFVSLLEKLLPFFGLNLCDGRKENFAAFHSLEQG